MAAPGPPPASSAAAAAAAAARGGVLQVAIAPTDRRLVFSLPAAAATTSTSLPCRAVLTIANTAAPGAGGPCYVAFKVKTTNPRRYLVRPCQGVLRPGERQELSVLVPPERQAELRHALLRGGEGESSAAADKFQVLYAGMDEATYHSLGAQPPLDGSRFDRAWAQLDRRLVRDHRMDVEFRLMAPSSSSSSSSATGAGAGASSFSAALPLTMAEYRKRYDDLVTSTVSLTAERDTLLNALDTLKFELRRELASQGQRGAHVAAGGTVKQDQLSLHKRRSSKASSVAFASSIPGIAAHTRDPSSGLHLGSGSGGVTGAGVRHSYRGEAHHHQQQSPAGAAGQQRFSPRAVAALAVCAFAFGRWLQ